MPKLKPTNLDELLEAVTPELHKAIADKATDRIADAFSWSIQDQVRMMVEKYINEHVLPAVEERLRKDHDSMVNAIVESVGIACEKLRDKLTEQVIDNCDRQHVARKVGEIIFGRGY